MSDGVLIYARNSIFDYVRLARLNLCLIRRNLGLPVALVTDSDTADSSDLSDFDQVIIDNTPSHNHRRFDLGNQTLSTIWKNESRPQAYDLSPFDRTLLIDADYLVFSDRLLTLFETDLEFGVFDRVMDVTGKDTFRTDRRIGPYALPMQWATVVYYTRNDFARGIFVMMEQVRANYRYYSHLYGFDAGPYRNDFALSIALHALSGYGRRQAYTIPWACLTLTTRAKIIDFDASKGVKYQYTYHQDGGLRHSVGRLSGMDLHVMDKRSILNFYDSITSSYTGV